MEGLAADYQLLIDLRSFNITGPSAAPVARVQFAAKILGDAGRIVGSRTFEAMVPAKDVNAASVAEALDKAFGEAATGLVTWTAGVILSIAAGRNLVSGRFLFSKYPLSPRPKRAADVATAGNPELGAPVGEG